MKISAGTIARTVCLCLALVNQVIVLFGGEALPIAENDIYRLVSLMFTVVSAITAWWKNNSFSLPAIKADKLMYEMKK